MYLFADQSTISFWSCLWLHLLCFYRVCYIYTFWYLNFIYTKLVVLREFFFSRRLTKVVTIFLVFMSVGINIIILSGVFGVMVVEVYVLALFLITPGYTLSQNTKFGRILHIRYLVVPCGLCYIYKIRKYTFFRNSECYLFSFYHFYPNLEHVQKCLNQFA